jgi:large repetitive protein
MRNWALITLLGCGTESKETGGPAEVAALPDLDGDGHPEGEDCDDEDPETHPEATELCDGADNDCDGDIDEGIASDWFPDLDGDGFGEDDGMVEDCEAPESHVSEGGDCNDEDPETHPNASESCDGADNDCDGETDEELELIWYADLDGDGFGNGADSAVTCLPPEGYIDTEGDCDDTTPESYPDAPELCDGLDNDCDGEADEGVGFIWYMDQDGDGFGDLASTEEDCEAPSGHAQESGDCDDNDSFVYPEAAELCDYIDNDCDGDTDEDDAEDALEWFLDSDGDGFGDPAEVYMACYLPDGYVADSTDCDDQRALSSPDASEYCTGHDDDCDGDTDEDDAEDAPEWFMDADSDGFGNPEEGHMACYLPDGYVADSTDCDDQRALSSPAATEYCNGIDDDCGGDTDEDDAADALEWYLDSDGDGFGSTATAEACYLPDGYVADSTDCDDGRTLVHPAATEFCNGIDDDCDGAVDENDSADAAVWFADDDGDGFGDLLSPYSACYSPVGHVADSTDCDDSRYLSSPSALEYCNSHDDDCDGTVDEEDSIDSAEWWADGDGDGFGTSGTPAAACSQPAGYVSGDGEAEDCNDEDEEIGPDAAEICDGLDNDCDGDTDDDDSGLELSTASIWYRDSDADSYGNPYSTALSCGQPSGYLPSAGDCDDNRAGVNPDASEICNGLDDDCNGDTDDADSSLDLSSASTWYLDSDNDSYGGSISDLSCSQPNGHVAAGGDCDDSSNAVGPAAPEVCNGIDDNCQDGEDEGLPDNDGDGICNGQDTEECDGIDNDGDGQGDEGLLCSYYIQGFELDDGVDISVNGVLLHSYRGLLSSSQPDVHFDAQPGQSISVYAYDTYGVCRHIGAIVLVNVASGIGTTLSAGSADLCPTAGSSSPFFSLNTTIPGIF